MKCAFISDLSARLEVRGVSVFESDTELEVNTVSSEKDARGFCCGAY